MGSAALPWSVLKRKQPSLDFGLPLIRVTHLSLKLSPSDSVLNVRYATHTADLCWQFQARTSHNMVT